MEDENNVELFFHGLCCWSLNLTPDLDFQNLLARHILGFILRCVCVCVYVCVCGVCGLHYINLTPSSYVII